MKLTDYLDSINLKPEEIANVTGLSSEMITGIIGGTIDIMCVDFGSVLLLCRCLKLPLSDFAGYCGTQNKNWQISSENDNYYLSFSFGSQGFRIWLAPVSPTNTKYINKIAVILYENFIDAIIDAKRGQVSVYRKQVEFELKKLDVSDTRIQLLDNEKLEEMLDVGYTPHEAATELAAREDGF